jgi:hypothetical protein
MGLEIPMSYLIKLFFWFLNFTVKLSCLFHKGKIIDIKMTELNGKRRKNYLFAKNKSFKGSATG